MRLVLLLLVTILLAWGVLQLIDDDSSEDPADLGVGPGTMSTTPPDSVPQATTATTGVLEITVRSKSGQIPADAEAGYRVGFEDRVRRVDERGSVLFTDAPLGKVRVLGRAPGYEPAEQDRFVNEGLRASVMVVLEKRDVPAKER